MYGLIKAEWIRGVGWASRPMPWVARLTGTDPHWGFQRQFIKAAFDYTYARKSGGRGIYLYFALPPGIYEVYYPTSWKRERRYFARVNEAGEVFEITCEEVFECLKSTDSE